ncbi:hypothetical protein [Shewanella sp. CG_4_10_14_0_8_um_filter_42_13]|uniref:hypothetical protein n=1 Tax=Shewanella sp. CG_4_10_14_0_8_um_filter_42_13 TaxID=1975534 RepID=UPI000CAC5254|nr:hypothetical protein [Shewanella sp. CG_4_10_14_0_8_um_filter_42_13]PIY67100.1 MAG: hypothetical protein COY92_07170 [Shewanella sp. CG_4_10_14_0_8_um_filter_42_13]
MFTPGPWKIGVAGPNGCPTVGTVNGLMVCHIAHSINDTEQKSQALGNSRLIKAAPEMFDLLALASHELESLINEVNNYRMKTINPSMETPPDLCDGETPYMIEKLLAEIREGKK